MRHSLAFSPLSILNRATNDCTTTLRQLLLDFDLVEAKQKERETETKVLSIVAVVGLHIR